MYENRVEGFVKAIEGARSVLILTHTNPDPDALGAAVGLRHLLAKKFKIRSAIGYSGVIGRVENKLMVRLLRINPHLTYKLKNRKFDRIILCDTHPDAKKPEVFYGRSADIILDHHPTGRRKKFPGFADIRTDYGSTSTIVTQYMRKLEVPLNAAVATAMFYGIKTDISDLARQKNDADVEAMRFLFQKVSVRWLYRIENHRLSAKYFLVFSDAIKAARVHKDAVVACLGQLPNADYVAELADYLLKLEGMKWSFCVGCANGELIFSVRTLNRQKEAGRIAHKIAFAKGGSGGGHKQSAAGRIPATNLNTQQRQNACYQAAERFLSLVGRDNVAPKPIGGSSEPLPPPCAPEKKPDNTNS